jgi:hypothetical protein
VPDGDEGPHGSPLYDTTWQPPPSSPLLPRGVDVPFTWERAVEDAPAAPE